MMDKIKQWIWNIISSGLPVDHNIEVLRKIILFNLIIVLGCIFLPILGTIAFIQRNYLLGTVDLSIFALLICLFIFLRKTKKHKLVSIIGTIIMGLFYSFLIASGGVNNTAYLWSFTYPLISVFLLGIRFGTFMSMLLLGMAGTVFAFGSKIDFFTSYSNDLIIRFVPAYVTIYLLVFVMEKVRKLVQSRLKTSNIELEKTVGELERANIEKQRLIQELKETINEIKTLQGILPICANCKKIRDDKGYWEQVESYIQDRSEAQFSHSICPECVKKLYPDFKIDKE